MSVAEEPKDTEATEDAPAQDAAGQDAPEAAAKKPARARKPAKAKAAAADAGSVTAEEGTAEEKAAEGKAAEGKAAAKAPKAKATKAKATKAKAEGKEQKKPKARTRGAKEEDAAKPAAESKAAPSKATSTARRPIVHARARYVRTSARKARMVCGHLRGKSVSEARAILAFTARDVARDWSKLLESAVANAENNHELLEDDLVVREAYADEGPTLKRFRPRAQGRATPIRKRTSHLTITLTPRP
jgi:ribosomal protein L22